MVRLYTVNKSFNSQGHKVEVIASFSDIKEARAMMIKQREELFPTFKETYKEHTRYKYSPFTIKDEESGNYISLYITQKELTNN